MNARHQFRQPPAEPATRFSIEVKVTPTDRRAKLFASCTTLHYKSGAFEIGSRFVKPERLWYRNSTPLQTFQYTEFAAAIAFTGVTRTVPSQDEVSPHRFEPIIFDE